MSAVLERPDAPGKRLSAVLAGLMHVFLVVVLIYGVRWQTTAPESVAVELVSAPVADEVPPVEAPPPPDVAPPPKMTEPKATEPEPKSPPKPEIALKDKAPKEKKKEPPKPEPKEAPAPSRFDAFKDALKRELAQLNNRRAAASADQDLSQHKASQAAVARNKGLADYLSRIRGKIRGNIVLPPGGIGNPEAIFLVTQLPSGEVLSVKLKTSSGNTALDGAIERAILKSSPLPSKSDNPDAFSRDLELKFRPLED